MVGRPKRVFSEEEKAKIDEMALNNCRDYTIAQVLNIPMNTFKRHFGKRCMKKRAEFKANLREDQAKLAKTNPAMAIFLGKNELGQEDKQTIKEDTSAMQALKELSDAERREIDRIAVIRTAELSKGRVVPLRGPEKEDIA